MDEPPKIIPLPPPIQAQRIEYPESPRLNRMRRLTRLLDTSIGLPGGYRIGIDPILGLLPGIGDFLGASLSFYLIYEAARLGMPKRILFKMTVNVLVETLVGEIPILGDLFDMAWKANFRNMRMVEAHYNPAQPERSAAQIILPVAAFFAVVLALNILAVLGLIWCFKTFFQALGSGLGL